MMNKREWHAPKFQSLDAAATAQQADPGTDKDFFLYDPNGRGDLGEGSFGVGGGETVSAFGNHHAQADAAS